MKAILSLIAVLAALALATPVAAQDQPRGIVGPSLGYEVPQHAPAVVTPTGDGGGFDWNAASLGGAVGIALASLAGVSLIVLRRRVALKA